MSVIIKFYGNLTLIWFVIFVTVTVAQAQEQKTNIEQITIGTIMSVDSEILDEERYIQIYLPSSYESTQNTRYPVLYLLDGETQFNHVTSIVDFLSGVYRIPPMIVIGVSNTDRMRDMTIPTEETEMVMPHPFGAAGDSLRLPNAHTAGGADNFMKFLTKELAPKIEREYRTAPFRLLVGHSLAGLFTIHIFMTSPQSFDAYLVMSPSLAWDSRSLIHRAQTSLESFQLDSHFLYMTAGENELDSMVDNLRVFAAKIDNANPKGLHWWHRVMPDESHPSVVHRTVYDGLEVIFEPYQISEKMLISGNIKAVEAHFSEASEILGYEINVPEQIINTMGYMQLQILQKPEKAIEIFRYNAKLYSKSANVYDSLGDGYSALGNFDDAQKSYAKAVKLAEEQKHPNLESYRANLQHVTKQLFKNKEE